MNDLGPKDTELLTYVKTYVIMSVQLIPARRINMEKSLTLKTFLEQYGESLAEKVTRELEVIHDPERDNEEELDKFMDRLHKNPFPLL